MEMKEAIKSSLIHSHGYDPSSRKMWIRFIRNGAPGDIWEYDEVPAEKYEAFAGSNSHGGFFHKKIKGLHTERKVPA